MTGALAALGGAIAAVGFGRFVAGGLRIARWMELKPAHDSPCMPTFPVDQGCLDNQSMISRPSRSSVSEYSCGTDSPPLLPVPRMSTRTPTRPFSARYPWIECPVDQLPSSLR